MAIDRSKFKDKVSSKALKQRDQEIENTISDRKGGYAGFLSIDDGQNKFRIYPPHPNDEGNKFVQAKQVWWLPVMTEKKDKNKEVVKNEDGSAVMVEVRKPIFDSRIHSENMNIDLVDEYIKFLKNKLSDDGLSDDEIEEAMLPIYGSYAKKIQGIVGKPTWIVYADKHKGNSKEFGRLEFGRAVKMGINDLIAVEEGDEPLTTEGINNPFTDVEEGRLLIVTYDSNAKKPMDYYKVQIDSSYDRETKMVNLFPLGDDDLEKFMEYPSLASLYKDSFKRKDFELQLEGLKRVDDKNNYGIFGHEEFLEIVSNIMEMVPEDEDESEETEKSEPKKEKEEIRTDLPWELDEMSRKELKEYIRENNIPFNPKPSMENEEIVERIREFEEEANQEQEETEKENTSEKEVEPKTTEKTKSGSGDVKAKMAAMKAKMKKDK